MRTQTLYTVKDYRIVSYQTALMAQVSSSVKDTFSAATEEVLAGNPLFLVLSVVNCCNFLGVKFGYAFSFFVIR